VLSIYPPSDWKHYFAHPIKRDIKVIRCPPVRVDTMYLYLSPTVEKKLLTSPFRKNILEKRRIARRGIVLKKWSSGRYEIF